MRGPVAFNVCVCVCVCVRSDILSAQHIWKVSYTLCVTIWFSVYVPQGLPPRLQALSGRRMKESVCESVCTCVCFPYYYLHVKLCQNIYVCVCVSVSVCVCVCLSPAGHWRFLRGVCVLGEAQQMSSCVSSTYRNFGAIRVYVLTRDGERERESGRWRWRWEEKRRREEVN